MKLSKKYLLDHKDELNNHLYGICLKDSTYFSKPSDSNSVSKSCFKQFIYKFTKNKQLVTEIRVVDVDRSYIYEEIYISLDDKEYSNFKIIGNIADLIKYIENDMVIEEEQK